VQLLAFTQAEWNESIDPMCIDGGVLDLNGASPAGGIYSGPGVENESFNPEVSGSGEHTIEYIYTHPESNCVSVITNSIFVAPLPVIEFALVDPIVCNSDNEIVLSGGISNSALSQYSGEFVTFDNETDDYIFNTSEAPLGEYQITYSSISEYGCEIAATDVISVHTFDPIIWTEDLGIFCTGSVTNEIMLPEPMGGIFDGGTVQDGLLQTENLDAGNYPLSYTYINEYGCESQTISSFDIIGINATWEGFPQSFCSNEESVPLTGTSPEGGTYGGIGIVDNTFNFSELEAGTYELTYTYIDELSGCSDAESIMVSIYETPVIDWSNNFGTYCLSDSVALIGTALPLGGTYFGANIIDGYVFLEELGSGTFPLEYTITNGDGCSASAQSEITVASAPAIDWTEDFGSYCENDEAVYIATATPEGGIYSGENSADGFVDPALLGVGTFTLFYNYISEDGCSASSISQITILALPSIMWVPNDLNQFDICVNLETEIALNDYASPTGGTFSSNQVEIIDNIWLNEPSSNEEEVLILYTYTDPESGCTATFEQLFNLVLCGSVSENQYDPNMYMTDGNTLLVDNRSTGRLRVFDAIGNIVFTTNTNAGKSQYTLNLAYGIYLAELTENGKTFSKKIVVR
jgi:hypothetical protein